MKAETKTVSLFEMKLKITKEGYLTIISQDICFFFNSRSKSGVDYRVNELCKSYINHNPCVLTIRIYLLHLLWSRGLC
jgi:hypothetical protein